MSSQDLQPSRGVGAAWPLAPQTAQVPGMPGGDLPAYGGYGSEQVGSGELTLARLWHILWVWRWMILGVTGACIAIALVVTLLTTPKYTSAATLEMNPPNVQVMGSGEERSAAQSMLMDRDFMQTQTGLLKSRALAERVAQDLNLASNEVITGEAADADRAVRNRIAVGTLAGGLVVKPQTNSRIIQLQFTSTDPSLAARIVNGFADGFISTSLERRYQSSSYARDFLQRQIGNVRRDLEKSERALVAYAQQQGIINTGSSAPTSGGSDNDGSSLTGASLIELNRALAEATTRRIQAEQQFRQAQASGTTAEVGERTAKLRSDRATLQAEYQDKLTVFRPEFPEMVRLRSRIESLDQAISAEERNVRSGRSGTLGADYRAAQAAESALRGRVAQLRGDVLNLRGRTIQYNILQRDVDTNRTLYDALLQRYKEIGVAGGIGQSNASVVDRGQVPNGPSSPQLILNLLAGLAVGLILGVGTALAMEFVNDTIRTPEDVRNRLQLAFIGGIPPLKDIKPVEALRDPGSPMSEAFFSAGTALSLATDEGVPKTLLVTSTRAAEGKSTTTWALAQHFARLGSRVLLIDADLRKPAFITGNEKEDGLSVLLTNRVPLAPHVVTTDVEGLWLLPCGPIPPNPAELLASGRMEAIVAEAKSQFDMVIVDGPPILGLADSPLLSTTCRGTLMVVEAGKTRTRAAVEALNRMRSAGANMIGCVLMRYRQEGSSYGYGYEAYTYKSVKSRDREIRAITDNRV